jgi:protein-S-isoprenylcysteine O-methyltransferase Ste14
MRNLIHIFNAIVVALCLVSFAAVNLDNLLRYHAGFSAASETPGVCRPMAVPLLLAGTGTVAFFLESVLYVVLGFSSGLTKPFGFNVVGTGQMDLLMPVGLLVMVVGYVIFIWSVLVRGRYAVSWQMPANHKLVERGPYRYVRHPSYLGYFLMFVGLLLLWQDALALIPLVGIPGYVLITRREEEMLVARFGERYVQYQKNVGRFFPKMSLRKSSSPDD